MHSFQKKLFQIWAIFSTYMHYKTFIGFALSVWQQNLWILMPMESPRHTYFESAGIKPNQPEWKNFQNSRLIREGISIEPKILTGLL